MRHPLQQFSIRLPSDVLKRVDDFAHVLREQHPGVTLGRADALRELLLRGLNEAGR